MLSPSCPILNSLSSSSPSSPLVAPTLLYLMMTAALYKKYGLKRYSTDKVYEVWLASAISSVDCQVLRCCLPYWLRSSGKQCKNSRWSTVSGLSCDWRSSRVRLAIEKTLLEEIFVAGVDRIYLAHMLNLYHVLLSMPIAEHIRSTVSRADVAVEFVLGH